MVQMSCNHDVHLTNFAKHSIAEGKEAMKELKSIALQLQRNGGTLSLKSIVKDEDIRIMIYQSGFLVQQGSSMIVEFIHMTVREYLAALLISEELAQMYPGLKTYKTLLSSIARMRETLFLSSSVSCGKCSAMCNKL